MKKVQINIPFLLFLIINTVISYAQSQNNGVLYKSDNYALEYDINNPDQSWELPKNLVEISGLSYIDKYRLACIQDEKGNLYIFNLFTNEIERKIDFEEDGDYEGVEIVNQDAWVMKSNGTFYRIKNYLNENTGKAEKYPTILSRKNDAEALGFEPVSNNLLIGCKGYPFVDDDKQGKDFKAIYRFDIVTKLLDLDPFMLIDLDFIKELKNYNTITKLGVELLANLHHAKGDLTFQPSALAIHPKSHEIYILASVGNLLMIYSPDKKIQTIFQLQTKIHPQPEGICFSPEGLLYISNEGMENKGTISVFSPKK